MTGPSGTTITKDGQYYHSIWDMYAYWVFPIAQSGLLLIVLGSSGSVSSTMKGGTKLTLLAFFAVTKQTWVKNAASVLGRFLA